MAQDTHDTHKKPDGKLIEHRFTAEPGGRSNYQALVGGLGVAALGAGTYATWLQDPPMSIAPFLFGGGALGLIVASIIGPVGAHPIRVGDAGVAVEKGGSQPERIAWFEVESVSLEDDRLVVAGQNRKILAPLGQHAGAAAWILKEATDRIPKRVQVPADRTAEVMKGIDEHGTTVEIEPLQVAGRRCKASGAIISFERDARTCARCGEVYDKKHVPEVCLTCDAPMTAPFAVAHA